MICMFTSSMVDRDFEPGHVKPMTIKLVFAVSPLSTHRAGVRATTGLLGIMSLCQSGATCLSTDSCFSELAL
jgi:hypothetical protein